MSIIKNDISYHVDELSDCWKICADLGKISVCYKVPKNECKTYDDVNEYVQNSDLF